MKKYSISYISNSGLTILNNIVEAKSIADAIEDIKGDTGVSIILSVVPITKEEGHFTSSIAQA